MKKFHDAPEASGDTLLFFIGNPWVLLALYLLLINLVTFLVFGLDKWKAKRKEKKDTVRRIPEKTLFTLSALGGSVGALLGMKVFHHKTKHWYFRFGFPVILILEIAGTVWLVWYFVFR